MAGMTRNPAVVAVDLTPVLPGGQNGGVKILALDLVPLLARVAPESRFVVLTLQRNHDELVGIEASNVRRFCVDAPAVERGRSDNLALRARDFLSSFVPPAGLEKMTALYRRFERAQGAPSLLRRLQADVLFCPFLAPHYDDGVTPFVSILVDLQSRYLPEFFTAADRARRARDFETAARKAARIVCISHYVRETATSAGAPPERTGVIHPAVYDRFQRNIAAHSGDVFLNRWALVPGEYLLYPANFWPHKNHANLIEAVRRFALERPRSPLKLVLTGADVAGRDRLVQVVHRSGLADRVVFAGYIDDAELYVLLLRSLALIFPSLYEGFGMPVLEAMAAGAPVLCSRGTSLPEIAGDAALMFDPSSPAAIAEAIARIVDDGGLRQRLIEAGPARAASFGSPRQMAKRYWQVLVEAAAGE